MARPQPQQTRQNRKNRLFCSGLEGGRTRRHSIENSIENEVKKWKGGKEKYSACKAVAVVKSETARRTASRVQGFRLKGDGGREKTQVWPAKYSDMFLFFPV